MFAQVIDFHPPQKINFKELTDDKRISFPVCKPKVYNPHLTLNCPSRMKLWLQILLQILQLLRRLCSGATQLFVILKQKYLTNQEQSDDNDRWNTFSKMSDNLSIYKFSNNYSDNIKQVLYIIVSYFLLYQNIYISYC